MQNRSYHLTLATPSQWNSRLQELPVRRGDNDVIPAFFFAHGHPGIAFKLDRPGGTALQGFGGSLHNFLKDFGPTLLEKYNPKAIVVFSAHWETSSEILVTDYGDDQPLLYDYYGFPAELYEAEWHSNGSREVTEEVIKSLKKAELKARKTGREEPRGRDGVRGPAPGLDHGVFIPFMLMFPEGNDRPFRLPVVQVSIDASLDPQKNIKLGQAVSELRRHGILILSGGLTIHTFHDWQEWSFDSSSDAVKEFEYQVVEASLEKNTEKRFEKMIDLTKLEGFRKVHPREEHFIPIYVAAGAGGDEGETKVLCDVHGCKTIAYGVV